MILKSNQMKNAFMFLLCLVCLVIGLEINPHNRVRNKHLQIHTIENLYHVDGLRLYDQKGLINIEFKTALELSNYLETITAYETNCDNYTDSFGAKEKLPLE